MVVVMGIMSVLMLLGTGAFITVRNQYLLDQAVENAITVVRDAQNRAVSFAEFPDESYDVKIWKVHFNSVSRHFYIQGMYETTTPGTWGDRELPGSRYSLPNNMTMTLTNDGSDYTTNNVTFVPPFGTPYIHTLTCSAWVQDTTKPTKEYIPDPSSTACTSNRRSILKITFTYKSKIKSVTINNQGEVSAD